MSKTKKILFVITQSEMGGAQRFVQTVVTHLDSSKYELLVAAGPIISIKNKVLSMKYELLDTLEKLDIGVVRLKHLQREIRPTEDLRACFELKNLIKTFHPDVLFLNSSKAGVLGSFVSKYLILNTKYLILYRIGGWSFNDPWANWKKKLWIFLEKLSASWKDIIIVNNQHDLDQAKSFGIKPRQSLELIHNGLDLDSLHLLPRDDARAKLFQPTKMTIALHALQWSSLLVGTIANFYPPKGLEYLIEAIHKLQFTNYQLLTKFVIIGDGEGRKKLELLITNYQLQDKVILVGQLADARSYLKAFDLFVLPSVKEGFPWAILEAMAAGLPVIATSVGAIPEIIQDGQNGLLVEPRNPVKIAYKLEQLLSNSQLRFKLGNQAAQTISQKFSLNKMVESIEKLL